MEKLIERANQSFYHAKIDQLVNTIVQHNNCAVIIAEEDFLKWIALGIDLFDGKIYQIILITNNLNVFYDTLKGKSVLLLAASDFAEGINLAIQSKEIINHIICVSSENKSEIVEKINLLIK